MLQSKEKNLDIYKNRVFIQNTKETLLTLANKIGVKAQALIEKNNANMPDAMELALTSSRLVKEIKSLVHINEVLEEYASTIDEKNEQLQNKNEDLFHINQSYEHFVPKQFLELLNKFNIKNIQLGNQIEKEMSILFADIRSFTSFSEQITPKENFDFLNDYFEKVTPSVVNNNGFVDKYIGDSIMALFPDSLDNALNAAIELQENIDQYNQDNIKKKRFKIKVGVGVHFGKVMLGIIGTKSRMEGTVISDTVNTAARLERMTKTFNVSILTTSYRKSILKKHPNYVFRFLGNVLVRGKSIHNKIFELFNGDTLEGQLKLAIKPDFDQAIHLYFKEHKIQEAKDILIKKVLTKYPNEHVSQFYVNKFQLNKKK